MERFVLLVCIHMCTQIGIWVYVIHCMTQMYIKQQEEFSRKK